MDKSVKFRIELETNGEKVLHNLSINADDFREAVGEAVNETQRLGRALGKMTEEAVLFNSVNTVLGQLDSAVGRLADDWNSFDQAMRAVNTMAGKGREEFQGLKDGVDELSKSIPLAKEELANGLYQVISNGVPEDNWIEFLNKSARSSVGGLADLGQTVTVTSTIIKNYGLAWDTAGEIQDKIQTTAKNGVTSFEQLAAALPRVSGNAATLGVSIDELMATFATLTGVSGNTAEVSTQLAAVFTALVKPSSEATEMAQQMGVQFDAAAIKAAGGMQNFLQQLTTDIQQYAAAHGMLEQEIYGKLFGSAESLRALIPLTGELKDTFERNVDAMADSAGTIDAAFEDMAGSGSAVARMLKNQVSSMFEWVGSVASSIQPYLSFIAVGGQAITGFKLMATAAKQAAVAVMALATAHKKNAVVSLLAATHTKIVALAHRILSASSITATAGTAALTIAVTALYAALTMGISAIITGLVYLFTSMGDEAEDAAGGVDVLQESTDAFNRTASDMQAELDMEMIALSNLIRQHKDAADKVDELNRKYGDALGNHKTAAEWYDTLVQKSKVYCKQLGYEAQARVLASQIAAKELEFDSKMSRYGYLNGTYLDGNGKGHYNWEHVKGGKKEWQTLREEISQLKSDIMRCQNQYDTCIQRMGEAQEELSAAVAATTEEVSWQTMSYTDLGKAIERQKTKVAGLAGVNADEAKAEASLLKQMEARYKKLGKQYGLSTESGSKSQFDGKRLIANAESYKAIGNNITYYQDKLEQTAPTETAEIERLSKLIARLKEVQTAIRNVLDAAGRPTELDTLGKIDAEIQYQQGLRTRASAEAVAGIDSEIRRLNALKTALEDAAHTEVEISELHTYEQVEGELAYYESKLKRATETERVEIQTRINTLRKLKAEWDDVLTAMDAPEDISKLNNIEALEKAVGYYSDRQSRASASEVADYQRTIDALNRKKDALTRLTELPSMQREVAGLDGLGGKKLTMELELIGLEGIKGKIRSLQKMLDDTENPLDDKQREEVTRLIGSWESYEAQLKKSQLKLTDAWGGIKGIGGGVESITDALQGNGDAWQRVTGLVDGMISVYDGISGIISIIQTLTAASSAHASTKIVEAAGEEVAAGAMVAAGATAVTTSAATTVALGAETAAWSALSAAKTFAAHAAIPFVGTAIAAGMVAAQQAIILAASVPKFAEGGLAYGPTLGIFGEYAGASRNPEVVAPLDKLRSIIGESGGDADGKVEFRIKGRRLMGVLEREQNVRRRR